MNTDAIFRIGSTHRVCQDYALCNTREGGGKIVGPPFVVVSDGCSTAENTDIGARLLALAAQRCLYRLMDPQAFYYSVSTTAHTFCRTMDLPTESISATLLVGRVVQDMVQVLVSGDGVVAALGKDGLLQAWEWNFDSGAPYYLRYELDDKDRNAYLREFGKAITCYHHVLDADGWKTAKHELELDMAQPYFIHSLKAEDFKVVAVFSDGVQQFTQVVKNETSAVQEPVPVTKILETFMAFKNFSGEFVQRRSKRAFEEFAAEGISNLDDFSMGVIAL